MKNIVITILAILLILTGGYIVYDKVLLEENKNQTTNCGDDAIENETLNDKENSTASYNIDDVAEKVYGKDMVDVNLILWNDGTFSYKNNVIGVNGLGRYAIVGEEIHLDFIFDINENDNKQSSSDDSIVITNRTKIIKIKSKTNYSDSHSNIELELDDLILTNLAQPAREGEEDQGFYSELKAYLQ